MTARYREAELPNCQWVHGRKGEGDKAGGFQILVKCSLSNLSHALRADGCFSPLGACSGTKAELDLRCYNAKKKKKKEESKPVETRVAKPAPLFTQGDNLSS